MRHRQMRHRGPGEVPCGRRSRAPGCPRDGRPPHRPARRTRRTRRIRHIRHIRHIRYTRRIRHTRRCRAGRCRAAGCAVRHGRPADRLRAALVPGRDRSDGPARRDLDRSRPEGAARQLAGQRGALLPGAGRRAGRSGPGGGLDDPRDYRPGACPRRDRDAGRGRAGGRGGGLGPALRAGDVLAARVRGRRTGPDRAAVSCPRVRERRPPRQARPRAVPARGAPAGRGPGPVPGAGRLRRRCHRRRSGGLFRGRGAHPVGRRAPAGPPGRALAARRQPEPGCVPPGTAGAVRPAWAVYPVRRLCHDRTRERTPASASAVEVGRCRHTTRSPGCRSAPG